MGAAHLSNLSDRRDDAMRLKTVIRTFAVCAALAVTAMPALAKELCDEYGNRILAVPKKAAPVKHALFIAKPRPRVRSAPIILAATYECRMDAAPVAIVKPEPVVVQPPVVIAPAPAAAPRAVVIAPEPVVAAPTPEPTVYPAPKRVEHRHRLHQEQVNGAN
jgi:hypothetical protein